MADTTTGQPDTVTIPRADFEALLERLEDAEDLAEIAAHRDDPTLSLDNAERIFAGEHPVTVWRQELGLSQRALAGLAGLSPGMLNEIEKGKKTPSLPTARAIAAALGLDLDTLFG